LESVGALARVVGAPVDPLRFRGNVYVDGLDPWTEFDLVGKTIASPEGVRLRVIKRIERCAATNVDPASGQRDREIPKALMRLYGHVDCGIYAEVLSGGRLAEGERLAVEPPAQAALPFG
jgi:uncharacterized protein